MPEFIHALDLSEAYYREAVGPILERRFPRLPHSAALIGYGSELLGFDTPVSRDHLWGPRLLLFLRPGDLDALREPIHAALRRELPAEFRGYSTHFTPPDPRDGGVRVMASAPAGQVDPLIFYHTLEGFWRDTLGAPPDRDPSPADWLSFTEQALIELTAGRVFHDDLGLADARARFAYYPRGVWLYLLAAQWAQIGQEEAFPGRTWQAGDALGSRVVTARQVERIMRLCFLMERAYAPYSKWFGAAFARLACAARMTPLLEGALSGADYPAREPYLAAAYSLAAEMHNALGITAPLDPRTRTYSGWHALREGFETLPLDHPRNTRPHQTIFAERFSDALRAEIRDPQVLALIPNLGSASQFLVESSEARQNTTFRRSISYDSAPEPAPGGSMPIYHILSRADWELAQAAGEYRAASLETEGFMHASTREQVLDTAARYYRGQSGLLLLEIDPAALRSELRYDPVVHAGQVTRFPHLYGPLNLDAVRAAHDFSPNPDGSFDFPGG